MKQIVKLRIKKLSQGQGSYYLDWYRNGKRYYDYLKLYVDLVHTDKTTRDHNKEIRHIALNLRNKKENEILSDISGGEIKTQALKSVLIIPYIRSYKNRTIANSTSLLFEKCFGKEMQVCDFTDKDVTRFYKYLMSLYSTNTVYTYMACLKSALTVLVSDNLISPTILNRYPKCKLRINPVTYLTLDEVRKIRDLKVGWGENDDRRAFLFACYTGLRFSDIRKLTWSEILSNNHILFSQQKTQIDETGNAYAYTTLPLNATALSFLGERQEDTDLVFPNLSCATYMNAKLKKVAIYAGITKNLHFHIARHTYGVQLINNGVDIYTVSKLLGHSNITTTAKYYANLTDKTAIEAVNKIPKL